MDTDTLWQILAVAAFVAALLAAGALSGWALYRNGRRDEAIARDEEEAWWDSNVRRTPDAERPELAVVAGVTPLPRRQPGQNLPPVGGWTPDQWRGAAGLTGDGVEVATFDPDDPDDDPAAGAPTAVEGRSS